MKTPFFCFAWPRFHMSLHGVFNFTSSASSCSFRGKPSAEDRKRFEILKATGVDAAHSANVKSWYRTVSLFNAAVRASWA